MVKEQLAPPVQADGRTSNKGTFMRAWIRVLRREGLFEAVRAQVVPEVARLLDDPPSGSAWVDVAYMDHVLFALFAVAGEERAEALRREAMREGFSVVIETFVRAIIRLFHASPHAVFARMGQIVESQARGMECNYVPTGEREGVFSTTLPYRDAISQHSTRSHRVAADIVLELCEVRGTVSEPTVEPGPKGGVTVKVTARWEAAKR